MASDKGVPPVEVGATDQLVILGALRRHLASVMQIDGHEILTQPDRVIVFRGRLHDDSEEAFERLSEDFAARGYTAWLRERSGGGHEVVARKGVAKPKAPPPGPNVVLFVATRLSVLYVGTLSALAYEGAVEILSLTDLVLVPLRNLHKGIPFAATLMGILLAHELSHYVVARRYGAPVSLPYFIPMPLPGHPFGTMGAAIIQRGPMRNRKAVFDIGVAGPIGGLIIAIPLLIYGLSLSSVSPTPAGVAYTQEGNSLLYLALKFLVFRRILPSNGLDVWLHPVAFAAWAGLFVTMINLLPVGQLDGGHVAYALLGRRSRVVGAVAIVTMFLLAGWLFLQGNSEGAGLWMLWGLLNLILNRRHVPALDDASGVDWKRVALGLAVALMFVLLFMPSPLRQVIPPGAVTL